MSPDDPRHGSTRGFHAGCRESCCRAAISRYQKTIRWNKLCGNRLSVPALGAQRRLQALMCLGWTGEDIAAELGWSHRNHVRRVLVGQKGKPCTWLERKTHDAIAEGFERLAMRLPERAPHRARCQTMARKRGWLPPLAWNDIDDPNERPDLVEPVAARYDYDPVVVDRFLAGEHRLPTSVPERREIVRRWHGSLADLERLTNWNTNRYRKQIEEVA